MSNDEPGKSEVARQLVRSFSDDLRRNMPNETLSRSLAFKETVDKQQNLKEDALRDQWNALLNEGRHLAIRYVIDPKEVPWLRNGLHSLMKPSLVPDEEVMLRDQSCRLYEAWTLFCKKLPTEQQKGILTERPSIKYLYDSVSDAAATWEENRNTGSGKIKKVFTHVCDVLNTHSNLVSIFPTDDKYVRLVTGSISAIARASINHTKLASGVADSLEELSQDMAYWNELIAEYGSEPMMHRFIIELYVVVVEFLTEVFVQWSRSPWKRFIKSFDQNAYQNIFVEKRKRIKLIEARMQRHADLVFKKTVHRQCDRSKTSQKDATQKQVAMAMQLDAIMQAQNNQGMLLSNLLLRLGVDLDKTLRESLLPLNENTETGGMLALEEGNLPANAIIHNSGPSPATDVVMHEKVLPTSSSSTSNYDQVKADQNRHKLQDILQLFDAIAADHKEQIQNLLSVTSRATRVEVDQQIRARIITWVETLATDKLWIQGPHEVSTPSQNTLTAAFLVALSNTNKIPCLHYFCSINTRQGDGRNMTSRAMLVQMLKSFIIQLLLMRKDNDIYIDIPQGHLERLVDATVETEVDDALVVFRSLKAVVPPHLHCVIEGLQELEDRGDSQHTRNLENVVREISSLDLPRGTDQEVLEESSRTLKLMYLSDGYVDALAQAIADDQLEKVAYTAEAERFEDGESTESSWLQEEDTAAW